MMDLSRRTNFENKLVLYHGHMSGDRFVWTDSEHELWQRSVLRTGEVSLLWNPQTLCPLPGIGSRPSGRTMPSSALIPRGEQPLEHGGIGKIRSAVVIEVERH